MRIAFTIHRLAYSGAPKMLVWVANQMARKQHDVHVIAFFEGENAHILDEDVKLHLLNVTQSKSRFVRNTTGMIKTVSLLHKEIEKIRPDIVVSFLSSVSYVYLPLGRLFTKRKLLISERTDPHSSGGILAKVRFFFMKFAHGTVFQTQGARKFFEKSKKIYNNSTVIPNPVVVDQEVVQMQSCVPGFEARDNRIVTAGRLSLKQKRQDVLIEAFKLLQMNHPELQLVIYGDGQDKNAIQAIIDSNGLAESVIMAGRTNRVKEEIFRARAFALTSDFEGIPNALIEAMSIGVPCVSTDCSPGGAALLIRDGANGFLVPRGDANALAEKLRVIVCDKQVSERFSQNGRDVTENFSEARIASLWEEYFMNVLQGTKEQKRC